MTDGNRDINADQPLDGKGVLVCLVGIDGAGKSTMAKALLAITEEHGINCRYV